MMNANEAKRMTNEVREAEAQKTREAARQTCETAISKRIEDAARNGGLMPFDVGFFNPNEKRL